MRNFVLLFVITGCCIVAACGSKEENKEEKTSFTKADSLMDSYLVLQDSLLMAWNVIVKDENEKLEAMQEVLRYLESQHEDEDQVQGLEYRLKQLRDIKINQANISNPYVVEEYDFASNSLVNEIISLSEADPSFMQNKTLQSWIDEIKSADQRVPISRSAYDSIATAFNIFWEKNKDMLMGLDSTNTKKPLFKIN